jgi:hypothetical protein
MTWLTASALNSFEYRVPGLPIPPPSFVSFEDYEVFAISREFQDENMMVRLFMIQK